MLLINHNKIKNFDMLVHFFVMLVFACSRVLLRKILKREVYLLGDLHTESLPAGSSGFPGHRRAPHQKLVQAEEQPLSLPAVLSDEEGPGYIVHYLLPIAIRAACTPGPSLAVSDGSWNILFYFEVGIHEKKVPLKAASIAHRKTVSRDGSDLHQFSWRLFACFALLPLVQLRRTY